MKTLRRMFSSKDRMRYTDGEHNKEDQQQDERNNGENEQEMMSHAADSVANQPPQPKTSADKDESRDNTGVDDGEGPQQNENHVNGNDDDALRNQQRQELKGQQQPSSNVQPNDTAQKTSDETSHEHQDRAFMTEADFGDERTKQSSRGQEGSKQTSRQPGSTAPGGQQRSKSSRGPKPQHHADTGRQGYSAREQTRAPLRTERNAVTQEMLLAQQPMFGLGGKEYDNVAAKQLQFSKESEARIHQQLAEFQAEQVSQVKRDNLALRKQFDDLRMENTHKQKQIQEITTELNSKEKLLAVENGYDKNNLEAYQRQRDTEERLEEITEKSEDALKSKEMYLHMKDRLKNEKTDLDVKLDELQDTRKSLDSQLRNLRDQNQSASEERNRAEKLARQLQKQLESSRTSRQRNWEQMNLQLQNHNTLSQSASCRAKGGSKQDQDQAHRDRLKHLYVAQKAYGTLLQRKIQDDQRRIDRLETAFQRIRSATGLENVDEIVEKFQSREGVERILQWSEKAAREKIDALREERLRLIWNLDDAETKSEGQTHPRALYTQLENIQRKLASQKRQLMESKEKSQRNLVLMEEVQACILKLLNRVDTAEQSGEPNGSEAEDDEQKTQTSLPGAGKNAEDEPLRDDSGEYRIDVAIAQLETKVSRVLSHLASVLEREEQLTSRDSTGLEAEEGADKSSQMAAALGVITGKTTRQASRRDESTKEDTGANQGAVRGAPAQVVAALANMKPAQSSENVRVSPRPHAGNKYRHLAGRQSMHLEEGDSDTEGSEEIEYTYGFAPDVESDPVLNQLHGKTAEEGIVIDRRSLKRLAAMLTDNKKGTRLRQAAASHQA